MSDAPSRPIWRHPEFARGARDMVGVSLGIAAWGLRLYATIAATGYFFWRRGILGTIVTGTLVMVALRTGLGW